MHKVQAQAHNARTSEEGAHRDPVRSDFMAVINVAVIVDIVGVFIYHGQRGVNVVEAVRVAGAGALHGGGPDGGDEPGPRGRGTPRRRAWGSVALSLCANTHPVY